MLLGAHMTIGKGFDRAAQDALSIGANAMQVFTRNPRGGRARVLDEEEIARLERVRGEGLEAIVCHAPYTMNLASSNEEVRAFSIATLKEDVMRAGRLGAHGLVLHTGAHTGAGRKIGILRVIAGLEEILPEMPVGIRILLEMMSGSGSELGSDIRDIKEILEHFQLSEKLGVCLDTCHLHAAGYDMRQWDAFKNQWCAYLPWSVVGCLHMNDSKTPLGSHKDRHERLGDGTIGWQAFEHIVQDCDLREIPVIMETPNELAGWQCEIEHLKAVLRKKRGA